jgi:hypothetical protein
VGGWVRVGGGGVGGWEWVGGWSGQVGKGVGERKGGGGVCMYVRTYVCTQRTCVEGLVCMYVTIYTYINIYTYMHILIYVCTCIHRLKRSRADVPPCHLVVTRSETAAEHAEPAARCAASELRFTDRWLPTQRPIS